MIKVLFFSFGPEIVASCRTRVYQYIPYLEKHGIAAKVINYTSFKRSVYDIKLLKPSLSLKIINFIFKKFQTFRVLLLAGKYDVVIVQRVLLPIWEQHLLKSLNPRIIFDFDDALYLVPQLLKRFSNMLKISKHLITTSKDNLEYAKKFNKNASIILTPVDIHRYCPKAERKNNGSVVIGWIGSFTTAVYLEKLRDVFRVLKEKYKEKISIKFVGSGELDWNGIKYESVEWDLDTEVKQLQNFDVGVMPLESDEWCRGKAGYKLLQYMAVGIPCAASPVGINKEIIKDRINGFLAETQEEWIDKLSTLVEDAALRRKMGAEGRNMAQAVYSYEANIPKVVEAIVSTKNAEAKNE